MFINSESLLPQNDSDVNKYMIYENDDKILYIVIHYKTNKTNDIIELLERKPSERKMYICIKNSGIRKYHIDGFYRNVYGELVLHVRIDKTLKNIIDNSKHVEIDISLNDYYDIVDHKQHCFSDFIMYI